MQDFDATAANYTPLSPLSFIRRAATVYPNQPAVVHGDITHDWTAAYRRARCLASALQKIGIGKNDTVSIMAPNVPALFDAHFGIPMAGAVLNPLNTRLDADTIEYILQHAEAKVLFADTEFAPGIQAALAQLDNPPIVIDIADAAVPDGKRLGRIEYEAFLESGDRAPGGRCRPTSGTPYRFAIRPAPPATRKVWSTTIAALICWRWAIS